MAKGIDQKFVHYGIRRDDLSMIEAICDSENIDLVQENQRNALDIMFQSSAGDRDRLII